MKSWDNIYCDSRWLWISFTLLPFSFSRPFIISLLFFILIKLCEVMDNLIFFFLLSPHIFSISAVDLVTFMLLISCANKCTNVPGWRFQNKQPDYIIQSQKTKMIHCNNVIWIKMLKNTVHLSLHIYTNTDYSLN